MRQVTAGDDGTGVQDTSEPAPALAQLLRQHRLAARLTQEALAERAGLSLAAVSTLERARRRRPHPDTVSRLADALALSPAARDLFVRAARPPSLPASPRTVPGAPLLSAPLNPMVGRDAELASACDLLRSPDLRLLTLSGPPGVGKTRLALAVAHDLEVDFPDGVVFVDLARVPDSDFVGPAIRHALGVRDQSGAQLLDVLGAHLGARRMLLVLDNFEHVLPAAPFVHLLLARCRETCVLVTSRAALRVRGEHELTVRPLPVPDAQAADRPEQLGGLAAVQLFVQRARAVDDRFVLTATNARHVSEICRRLDGLPLALELSAGWIRLFAPDALLGRLERRLPVLVGGPRDLPDRQRTMRSTLRWSHDLLSAPEQTLFRRLSVFAGGADVEAAVAVCQAAGRLTEDPLDLLSALAEKNLVHSQVARRGPRVAMLETVREYSRELLDSSGELEATARAHAEHLATVAEAAEPEFTGGGQADWFARVECDHDNVRAALGWCRESGTVETGLRLAAPLWRFWDAHGHWSEGQAWLDSLLALDTPVRPEVRARACNAAGNLCWRRADYAGAVVRYETSLAMFRALGDVRGCATALSNLGSMQAVQGNGESAVDLHEQSLALRRALGDRAGTAASLNNLAAALCHLGDLTRANALLEESLDIRQAIGDSHGAAVVLNNLGDLARRLGNHEQALAWLEESVARFTGLEDDGWVATSLHTLGDAALAAGDGAAAADHYGESLDARQRLGNLDGVAYCLEGFARVAAELGRRERAVRLLGAAATIRTAVGAPVRSADRGRHDQMLAALRGQMGDDAYAAAWSEGSKLSPDAAAAEARGRLAHATGAPGADLPEALGRHVDAHGPTPGS